MDSDSEQFRAAVKNLVETHQALKKHNAVAKEMRENLKALKSVVMAFMESAELEICNVNHNGKDGELAVRTSKRIKTLKKDGAISQIEKYLAEETNVDQAGERASLIWEALQSGREQSEVKNLSVRKF